MSLNLRRAIAQSNKARDPVVAHAKLIMKLKSANTILWRSREWSLIRGGDLPQNTLCTLIDKRGILLDVKIDVYHWLKTEVRD